MVVVEVSVKVEGWGTKGENCQHGNEGLTGERTEVTAGSIIFDLFARDADVALGRKGFCSMRGRGKAKYLEKYTWLFEENEAGLATVRKAEEAPGRNSLTRQATVGKWKTLTHSGNGWEEREKVRKRNEDGRDIVVYRGYQPQSG